MTASFAVPKHKARLSSVAIDQRGRTLATLFDRNRAIQLRAVLREGDTPHDPRIFISYRREDTGYIARIIEQKLSAEYGQDAVFLDIDKIPLGTNFRDYISREISRCDILLVLVGDSWLKAKDEKGRRRIDVEDDFVRLEIEAAIKRDMPVIPVLGGSATMPSEAELPDAIAAFANHNAAQLRSGHDLQNHLDSLVAGIRQLDYRRSMSS